MAKLEPEAATKPRFVEAESIPSQPSHETEQPANPAGPAKFAPSAIAMRGDSTKAQNDTRPPSDESKPATSATGVTGIPGTATAKQEPTTLASNVTADDNKVEKAEEDKRTLNKSDSSNPDVKLEGPGPRPLEEIAREHGGNAAAANEPPQQQRETTASSGVGGMVGEGAAGHQRKDSGKSLLLDDNEEGVKRAGKKGTSEEHVISSGLAADGGDFDASRPGAAREADREYLPDPLSTLFVYGLGRCANTMLTQACSRRRACTRWLRASSKAPGSQALPLTPTPRTPRRRLV
jgi:hypothetical protein